MLPDGRGRGERLWHNPLCVRANGEGFALVGQWKAESADDTGSARMVSGRN